MDDIHKAHDKHGDALVDPLYNSNKEKIPKQKVTHVGSEITRNKSTLNREKKTMRNRERT